MHLLQEFVENIDLKELQKLREDASVQEEQETRQEAEEFHKEFGSEEEIYSEAQEAAAAYLAELGVEDEEEDEEPEREPTEEDWNDTPGMFMACWSYSAMCMFEATCNSFTSLTYFHLSCCTCQLSSGPASLCRPILPTSRMPTIPQALLLLVLHV